MEFMKSLNFAEVYDMLGGITDWEANGLPVVDATTPATTTAGELASSGATLYNKTCTHPECHSKFGEGGEIEFTSANLSQYGSAETVFGVISSIMHLNIGDYQEDAPTQEEYLQVLAYLLVQSEIVQSSDPFDRNSLPGILIE